MPELAINKQALRKQLRARRNALSDSDQQTAATDFFRWVSQQPFLRRAQRIACYVANNGELNLQFLIRWCWQNSQQVFLPALKKTGLEKSLLFLPTLSNTSFTKNRYGIAEPMVEQSAAVLPWQLDVVFLPLVGFDKQGGRLGMGGGYYDRTFSNLKRFPHQPLLIGVGHHCQEVESIPKDTWDLPMDAIVSDQGLIYCRQKYRYKFNSKP